MDPAYKVPVGIVSDHVYKDDQWSGRSDIERIELKTVLRSLDEKLHRFFGVSHMAVGFMEVVKSFVGSFVVYEYLIQKVRKLIAAQKESLECKPILIVIPALMVPRLTLACQKHMDGSRVRAFVYGSPSDDDFVDALPW